MHGTALAGEPGAKDFQNTIGLDQNSPEFLDVRCVVSGMMLILVEGSGIGELHGPPVDLHFDAERLQTGHVFVIEIRHGTGIKTERVLHAVAGPDREFVRAPVELYLEGDAIMIATEPSPESFPSVNSSQEQSA